MEQDDKTTTQSQLHEYIFPTDETGTSAWIRPL